MGKPQLSIALLCAAAACAGDPGATGATGETGASVVASTTPEPAGSNCAAGGVKLSYGVDDNRNGTLDPGEVDGESYICNGSSGGAGHNTLVATSDEAAGANCAAGGIKIESGVDENNNGTLEAGEVDATSYVCAPTRNLVATAEEPPGANCPNGGTVITTGLDDNDNGTLEAGEVDATAYACDGSTGLKSLVRTSAEPVGTNCVVGGTRIDYGLDDNNNNVLEAGEIDGTNFVCEAGALFNSVPTDTAGTGPFAGGCGSHVNVGAANVVVRKLGTLTNAPTGGNMKYVILDHAAGHAVVYTSAAKPFVASNGWKYSDPVGVTLLAGGQYCIATIADVSVDYRADFVGGETGGGLKSVVGNTLIQDYASPAISGHGSGDCAIQVITY